MTLKEKILKRSARVVVVGGGYVGRPLAAEIAKAGFSVVIYDTDQEKVAKLKQHGIGATASPEVLGISEVVIVCVPTPLNKTNDPDNSFVLAAIDAICQQHSFTHPQLVILESTTFPGFTREVVLPKLFPNHIFDKDFFLAFSPERIDPGNTRYGVTNTPKIVGGSTSASLELATAFYGSFIDTIVPVSSTDAAEMVKMLENTFRAVNIGLVNEIAIMCRHLNLNVWELIDAAATKPFGFVPFYPGPGLGGHCIPVDPLYLAWKLRTLKYTPRFIELANNVNRAMPAFVVQRVTDALNDKSKSVRGSRILLFGVAYKRDVGDVRESPAIDIWEQLEARGAEVDYFDRHVTSVEVGGRTRLWGASKAAYLRAVYNRYDCAIIVTDHTDVDYAEIVRSVPIVIDCRNATRGIQADNIVRL